MLNKKDKKEKVYQVEMNKTPSDEQLEEMSRGKGRTHIEAAMYR